MYGPGSPPRASKHSAVSSVTQGAFSALAAAAHLALATSCVVPWSSGTAGVSSVFQVAQLFRSLGSESTFSLGNPHRPQQYPISAYSTEKSSLGC